MDTQFINQLITGGGTLQVYYGRFHQQNIYVYIYIDFYIQPVYNGDLQKQHYDKWGMAIHSIGGILLFVYLLRDSVVLVVKQMILTGTNNRNR